MTMAAEKPRDGPTVRRSLGRVFAAPVFVGIASFIGLVAALVGDGIYDIIGWLGLGAAVLASLTPLIAKS
jgi:hypothetical protein